MSALVQTRSNQGPHLKLVKPLRHLDLCEVTAIPLGQGRAFVVGGRTVAVFRQRDGAVFAIDNACPHRGGPLVEGIAGGGHVICPLHGWKIDLRSGRCNAEDRGVRTYAVEVIGERVWLTVDADA